MAGEQRMRSHVDRQLATMTVSLVSIANPMALVRAAAWRNTLGRLGLHLPLFVVHDLGILFTTRRGQGGWEIAPRRAALARVHRPTSASRSLSAYTELLEKLGCSEVVEKLAGWRLRDELVAVLLNRALGEVYNRWRHPAKGVSGQELPLDVSVYSDFAPAELFADYDPDPLWSFLDHLAHHRLHVLTSVELIDLDTVRLLGLFRGDTALGVDAMGSGIDLVDLTSALGSTEASDVASFSLDLLPSVLEAKRASGAQTFAVDGYASVERQGNVDSLMLSELAYDQEIFEQKVVDHELLYFGHEKQRDDEKRLQYVLVDSSASMRGRRQVFARGLALALVKKLSLQGDEVWLRFFDARLHELIKISRGSAIPVPHLLSFQSERGRNYEKVFRSLLLEMTRIHHEQRRNIVLYIVTHGQAHIAPELVTALAQFAYLYGIIILPSQTVALDFLPLLHRSQIVQADSLLNRSDRRERALHIVDDATERSRGVSEVFHGA